MLKVFIFSPCGHTAQAAEALASAWEKDVEFFDISSRDFPPFEVPDAADTVLFAVPSFGGRVPVTAAEKLKGISGQGNTAILLVSYGNRDYDDTFAELEDIAVSCGFRCAAGVAAVAEHTICPEFAAGRPHQDDREQLKDFGRRIIAVLSEDPGHTTPMPGNRPCKNYGGIAVKPTADEAKCLKCGKCAGSCPAGAIDPLSPAETDPGRCIVCMRCTVICPAGARALPPEMVTGIAKRLAPVCSETKNNTLFL